MTADIIRSMLAKKAGPEILNVLTEGLSGTDLNSLLLEVFRLRTSALSAPELLNRYQRNRLVKPSDLPALETRQAELEVLRLFSGSGFTPVDLSPVSILGSCSALGPVNQHKVLSALRGTEVLADSTNAIALHYADLRERKMLGDNTARFSVVQRHVRSQAITGKGFTPHFRVGCLVTCGRDTGSYQFEKTALSEHLKAMHTLFTEYYHVDHIGFRLQHRAGYPDNFSAAMHDHLRADLPDFKVTLTGKPGDDNAYYKGLQYKVDIYIKGRPYEIADGGFVDWTQQLLQNRKERMFSTGFGFDFMCRLLNGQL